MTAKSDVVRALVIDAREDGRRLSTLGAWGSLIRTAPSLPDAMGVLDDATPEVVLVGAESPDAIDAVEWFAEQGIEVYLVCDHLDAAVADKALAAGARGIVPRGAELTVLGSQRIETEPDLASWRRAYAPDLIGEDPGLLDALSTIRAVADTEASVLVRGESGCGKELLARAIHHGSPRGHGPFIAINCAAIPDALVEAELFGHTRGAFTGAQGARLGVIASADGGTLFLDEIGDMPLGIQAKLLRVLQSGEMTPVGSDRSMRVAIRVVVATHRDLESMVAAGEFRADLYYRLNVVTVDLPPLRSRFLDVLRLALYHMQFANRLHNRAATGFDQGAVRAIIEHAWPGNIRELANAVARAVLVRRAGMIRAGDLRLGRRIAGNSPMQIGAIGTSIGGTIGGGTIGSGLSSVGPIGALPGIGGPDATPAQPITVSGVAPRLTPAESLNLRAALDSVERELIERALQMSGGNRSEAAALLGLNRTTLLEKLRKHGT
jgi:DNA-binding NtrC family response regulator